MPEVTVAAPVRRPSAVTIRLSGDSLLRVKKPEAFPAAVGAKVRR